MQVLSTPKLTKKLGPAQIDWTNQISRGLIECYQFNEGGQPLNLAVPITAALSGAPTWVNTKYGPAGYATGGKAFQPTNYVSWVLGSFSIRVLFQPVSWPGAFTALYDKAVLGGSRQASVFVGTTGNISFSAYGAGGGLESINTGFAPGSIWDFIVTRSGTSGTPAAWVNGSALANFANNSAVDPGISAITSLGGNPSGGGSNPDVYYILFQVWNRALQSNEIAWLYSNPFDMITYPDHELPALFLSQTFNPAWAFANQNISGGYAA